MKTKRLAVILIAIAFFLAIVFSCIALFTVKKIQVNYAVDDTTDSLAIQSELDKFLGKNLLFLDLKEVENSLKDFHYMEVVSVDKQLPNVISVEIKERREVYEIIYGGNVYVTTDDGFVLNIYQDTGAQNSSRDKIRLELDGISVTSAQPGSYITTNGDELMSAVFAMAKSVHLTNCIESVRVEMDIEKQYAYFNTYTGVNIEIWGILDDGVKKIEFAFEKYDEVATDFEKTFETIIVYKSKVDGQIKVVWSGQKVEE